MAKKKDKPVIEKPKYTEFDSVDALTDEEKEQRDTATYHATFTPTWRPEIDCGEHTTMAYAKEAIDLAAEEFGSATINAKWEQWGDNQWLATGFDGLVETNLQIATITQVR